VLATFPPSLGWVPAGECPAGNRADREAGRDHELVPRRRSLSFEYGRADQQPDCSTDPSSHHRGISEIGRERPLAIQYIPEMKRELTRIPRNSYRTFGGERNDAPDDFE
jgi:hypothetical protein